MTRLTGKTRFLLILMLTVTLGGCQSLGKLFDSDREAETETLPVESMYAVAKTAMDDRNYNKAARYWYHTMTLQPDEDRLEDIASHRVVAEAIARGDGPAAMKAMLVVMGDKNAD